MDVSDIGKIATRKKLCEDVEKIREKVARENNRIIELKVAQDTAYWDVQEKLRQLEGNHERLQNNMVEIQMQYESTSSKLQDELRMRPETLNKAHSVRALVEVVEDYANKLRGILAQASEDRDALTSAFSSASRTVIEQREKCALEKRDIKDRYFIILRKLNENTVNETQAMRTSIIQLINSIQEKDLELKKKNDIISSLQLQLNEVLNKNNNIEIVAKKCEIQMLDYERRIDELNAKINNAEEAKKNVIDKCTAVENERNMLQELLDGVKCELQSVTEREANKVSELEMKLAESDACLNDEKEAAKANVEQLTKELTAEQEKFRDLQLEFEQYRAKNESSTAAANETMSKLMCDLRAELNARCKIEADLKADAAAVQERNDLVLKNMESELAKQKTAYEDLVKEYEQLQDKNRELQNNIDNKDIERESFIRPTVMALDLGEQPECLERPIRLGSPQHPEENEARFDVYNFQSDSSIDSDIHMVEVNRRFEALKKRAHAGACNDKVANILGVAPNLKSFEPNPRTVGINPRLRTGKARRQQLPAQLLSPSPFQTAKIDGNKKPAAFF